MTRTPERVWGEVCGEQFKPMDGCKVIRDALVISIMPVIAPRIHAFLSNTVYFINRKLDLTMVASVKRQFD